jgi:mitotic spindle assembly checkpoint protein MAD2B
LEKNTVEKIALCIFDLERNMVLEKWTFDLRSFPLVEKLDRDTPFERQEGESNTSTNNLKERINVADLEAQFRAVLSRVASASARLSDLPKQTECSFTVSIEVRDEADRPVGRLEREERKWVAAEPKPWGATVDPREGLSAEEQDDPTAPPRKRHGKTVPVRRLEAGELRMEVWVEESKEKFTQENSSSAESCRITK